MNVNVISSKNFWGEPKRAPHLRVDGLPAYASGVVIYIYMSIFRPTILGTFLTSGALIRLFEGPKRFRRRLGRPEEDVDDLFETIDETLRSRRRFFR